ncbi:unnamed protein product [Auanema sp. JU1783]|nr:unnamed protein product [Auanema sp. JU1783]
MAANVQAIFQAVLFIACLAILGVVIANLVTTINVQNQNQTPVSLNLNVTNNNNNNGQPQIPIIYNVSSATNNFTIYNNTVYNTSSIIYYQPASPLNVQNNPVISNTSDQYSSYRSFAQSLSSTLNVFLDPCKNFYEYTCSNIKSAMSFEVSDDSNTEQMRLRFENQDYRKKQNSTTLKNIFNYYDNCKYARANWDSLPGVKDGQRITDVINTIGKGNPNRTETVFKFPLLDQTTVYKTFPTPIGLGYLAGFPLGQYGIPTFVSAYTDTKWKTPEKGYALLIDQPTTYRPNTYYLKDPVNTKNALINEVVGVMNAYAQVINKNLNQEKLLNDAMGIVNLDFALALNFSTDDTTRRQFARSNILKTMDQLKTEFATFSFHTFVPNALMASDDAVLLMLDPTKNSTFVIMEGDKLHQLLNTGFVDANKFSITPNDVVNYAYYAAVRQYSAYLPQNSDSIRMAHSGKPFVLPQRPNKRRGIIPERKHRYAMKQLDDDTLIGQSCASETMDVLQYANARVFIDQIYPDQNSRNAIRTHVAKVANSILIGMRSMIDQLNWMSPQSKVGAYQKIEKLTKNMAYPDFIANDDDLDRYHLTLGFTDKSSYFDMVDKANTFGLYWTWQVLLKATTDRQDFAGPPGTTNAWYQDELNSITFPAGILHPPFYDFNWPAAVNFGAMGVIAGHELTHGFDDQGVQWDGLGALNTWMNDTQSTDGFKKMAQCVIDEYSGFCPLNKTVYGSAACIDGQQTQGENIADNGGIHSAYRAYKNYISFNGPDPQLPDSRLSDFTPDQLFFLSFAQVWCQTTPSDARFERQILTDVHSPSIYRVFGTIQNFPAFRSAFNCPAGSPYAPIPGNYCNVWVSDIDSSYGLPK